MNTPDGGYVATGTAETFLGGQYHWMVKVDSCGYEVPGYCSEISVDEMQSALGVATAYPNPPRDYVVVDLNKHFAKAQTIRVTNTDGKIVYDNKVQIELKQVMVPLQNVLAGTYFISLHDDGGKLLQTISIVVE
jgi:hypothetical protein